MREFGAIFDRRYKSGECDGSLGALREMTLDESVSLLWFEYTKNGTAAIPYIRGLRRS